MISLVTASLPRSQWKTEADTMVRDTKKSILYVGHVQNCESLPIRSDQYPIRRHFVLVPYIIIQRASLITPRYIPPRGDPDFSVFIGAFVAEKCLKQYTSFVRRRAKYCICCTDSARALPIGRIRQCDRHSIAHMVVIDDRRQAGERWVHY